MCAASLMASALVVALMRACWHDQPTLSVKKKGKGLKNERDHYPLDRGEICWLHSYCLKLQVPVVQKLDSAIHQINHYPLDSTIGFPNTYPLGRELSGG